MCKHPLAFLGLKTVEERRLEEATRIHQSKYAYALRAFSHRVVQTDESIFYVEVRHQNNDNWRDLNSNGLPKGYHNRRTHATFELARDFGVKAEADLRHRVQREFTRLREFNNTFTPPGYESVPIHGNVSDEALFIQAVETVWCSVS